MRALLALALLLLPGAASAQEVPYRMITVEEGRPLVYDRLPLIPEFDYETQVVAILVHPFMALEADTPFFISSVGEVIQTTDADAWVLAHAKAGEVAVLLCSGTGTVVLNDPEDRRRHCVLREIDAVAP